MTQDIRDVLKLALEALISCEMSNYGRDWVWPVTAHEQAMKDVKEAITAIKEALAQPEQEPDYWLGFGLQAHTEKPFEGATPVYTTPPQRTWVGLTDEEIKAFDTWHDNREEEVGWCNPSEIVAYIEAKLKEKNT